MSWLKGSIHTLRDKGFSETEETGLFTAAGVDFPI